MGKLSDMFFAGIGAVALLKVLVEHREFVREEKPYLLAITQAANQYGVDKSVLSALLFTESRFNPRAIGKTGDIGIAQFTPIAFRDNLNNGFKLAANFEDYAKPEIAIPGAAFKLALDRKRTGSIFNAVRAYNTGPDLTVNGDPTIGLNYAADVFRVATIDKIYNAFDNVRGIG